MEQLKEATEEQRVAKLAAIRSLLELQRQARGKVKLETAIKEALANPAITPQEVADVKRGMELSRKPSASMFALAKPSDNFKKATNGAQALTQIIKTGNAFEKLLAARLRGFVSGVKFVVIEKGDPLPEQLQTGKNAKAWERARGLFIQKGKDKTVYVRGSSFGPDQGVNNVTVLHEMLHAATNKKIELGMLASYRGFSADAKITQFVEEINGLAEYAQSVYEYSVARGIQLPAGMRELVESTGGDVFTDPREFVAYGMSDPVFQEFLNKLQGRRQSGFSQFVQAILRLFGLGQENFSALSDLIDVTDQLLSARKTPTMELVERGLPPSVSPQAAPKKPKDKRSIEELDKEWRRVEEIHKKSVESTQFRRRGVAQKAAEKLNPQEAMEWARSFWPVATKAQREVIARLPSMPFLGDWAADAGLPHIKEASDLMTAAIGADKVLAENTEQVIYQLKRAFKADPTLQDKLTALVYKTTNAKVDPSDPNATERIARADADFDALSDEGRRLYVLVKEHYEERGDLFLQLLEDNLTNMGLEPDTQKNLVAVLRKNYEAQNRIRPYFPFVREDGDYWLSVGKGDDREFYIYKSLRDRDADRNRIVKERKLDRDEDTRVGDNIDSLRNLAYDSSSLIRETFDAIDKAPAPTGETEESHAKYKEALKDAIYQGYLNVLPEKSFRGMFKNRKGLAGYNTDLIQNIALVDGKMNQQLARLEYAQKLRNVVDSAQSAIAERPGLQPFVDELRRRVDAFLVPAPHNWADVVAGLAGRIGFTYLLSGLSLPIIQPLALFTSGLSTIWGNYKTNPATAGAELLNAFANFSQYGTTTTLPDGTKRYNWPSLTTNPNLSEDERLAMKAFAESGMHESTLAREIWNHAGKPTSSFVLEPGKELEYATGRTMQGIDTVIGSPFHIIERWTREAMFLAAYRIGRNKRNNLSREEAIKKSIDSLKEALGDYSQSAKPRWMQRGFGKMAFALRTFAVLMTQQILGNLIKAIPFLNKEGKIAAIKKFSGLMFTTGLIAGASGVPLATIFYSMAGGLILAMQADGDDDDETEEEAELRNTDKGMWFRHVWLPQHIPNIEIGGVQLYDWLDRGIINAMTGLDVASRVQLSTVWGPDIEKPAKTPMEAATNLAVDYFAGAYFSLLKQFLNAYDAYSLGDTERAKELVSPKAIRDWLKADRYEKEGVKFANKEVLQPGALTALELWGQRLGFTPDIIAITQKEGIKGKAIVEAIDIERKRLLRKLDIAATKDTPEGDAEYERLLKTEVEAFNEKHPDFELKQSDINESIRMKEKLRENAIAGVEVNRKQADALAPLLERMNKRVEDREKKVLGVRE